YKLCKVKSVRMGPKKVPYIITHDARTIRYPNPHIKSNDTVKVDIATGKIEEHIKFDTGNVVMITGGHNLGRVGIIQSRERHPGSFDIVHVKDSNGHTFATRLAYVFVIGKGQKAWVSLPSGKGQKAWVSLPSGKGIRLSVAEERDRRLSGKTH
ncbi:unnamed protein product, partial [Rotaria socialis]